MEPANLKDFMRSYDPAADISRERMTRLYSSILSESAKQPHRAQAYTMTITPLQTTPWLAGALLMLALGIFTAQNISSPYSGYKSQDIHEQALANTWQAYMQMNK